MAQDRAIAGSEHRRHPSPLAREARMADRIDPAMDPVQSPVCDAMRKRRRTEPQPHKLPSRDDSVLPRRQARDSGIDGTGSQFRLHARDNCEPIIHPASFRAAALRHSNQRDSAE
jgi:hypothetical protein